MKINKLLNSVERKLYLIYFIIAIPIFVIIFVLSIFVRNDQIENKINEINNVTAQVARNISDLTQKGTELSNWLYYDTELSDLALHNYQTNFEVYEKYKNYTITSEYIKYYPEIRKIKLYVENQTALSGNTIIPVTKEIRDTIWYRNSIKRKTRELWAVYKDETSTHKNLTLNRSIYLEDGQLVGVLAISFFTDNLISNLNQSDIPMALVLNGQVIFSNSLFDQYKYPPNGEDLIDAIEDENNIYSKKVIVENPDSKLYIYATIPKKVINEEVNRYLIYAYMGILTSFLFSYLLLILFVKNFGIRVTKLKKNMDKVANGYFNIPSKIEGNDEIAEIYSKLYMTMQSQRKLIYDRYKYEIDNKNQELMLKEAEFSFLASQINPHFLYNALENIRMQAVLNNDRQVANAIKILSRLLRRALETPHKKIIDIEDELKFVDDYMKIQKMRFEERIEYALSNNLNNEQPILPLIIQPLVENAVVHGMENISRKVTVSVKIMEFNNEIWIKVHDNGSGIEVSELIAIKEKINSMNMSSKNIGLVNVNKRIKLYYGEQYGLEIESVENVYTCVTLKIPKIVEDLK